MSFGDIPFGMTAMSVFPLDGSDALGTGVVVPVGRKFEISPKEDTNQLTGFNAVMYSNVSKTSYDVTMEFGGIQLAVLAAITGATIVSSGTTPNAKKVLSVGEAGVARPYVAVVVKSLGDDGGDVHWRGWKIKYQLPAGNFNEGEYYVSSLKGEGVRNTSGKLYQLEQHETAAAISATP